MKRQIHVPAFVGLVIATAATIGALMWVWFRNQASPGHISCSAGGFTVPSCSTSFGDDATLICAVGAPVIGWLAYKAFFTKLGRS